jgi:osmotically-inducible protein OsmY
VEDASSPTDVKQNQEIPPRPGAISGATDAELQAQIQKALRSEPTLSSDNLTVLVSANTIELSGSVASARARRDSGGQIAGQGGATLRQLGSLYR